MATRCAACGGTGWRLPPPCSGCAGRGTRARPCRIAVAIPPGVDTGAQVRVPDEGHAAPAPGRRGDLIVITRVRPHPLFTRKGDHLHCEVPLTVPEAALGARIQIPTPDGPVAVTIPAGTQTGQTLRVRGKGWPRLDRDGRGDLLVQARVMIPRNAGPRAGRGPAGPATASPGGPAGGALGHPGATGGRPVSDRGRPLYRISVVAEMLALHPQTLRLYEKKGLIRPSRTTGRTRVYSAEDVEEIRLILRLAGSLA